MKNQIIKQIEDDTKNVIKFWAQFETDADTSCRWSFGKKIEFYSRGLGCTPYKSPNNSDVEVSCSVSKEQMANQITSVLKLVGSPIPTSLCIVCTNAFPFCFKPSAYPYNRMFPTTTQSTSKSIFGICCKLQNLSYQKNKQNFQIRFGVICLSLLNRSKNINDFQKFLMIVAILQISYFMIRHLQNMNFAMLHFVFRQQ